MHKFKVGQRYRVLDPIQTGVEFYYSPGDIMEVTNIINGDAKDRHYYAYSPNWVEEGFLELIGEEGEFDITTLYEGSAKEGKVITKGAIVQECSPTSVSIVDGRADIIRIKKEDLPNLIAGLMEFMNDE